jgi:hypothetical protein
MFGSETTGTEGQSAWTLAASLLDTAASVHSRRSGNQRRMKRFARVPITNKPDADIITHSVILS